MSMSPADPYREARVPVFERRVTVLGADFLFRADDEALLALVDAACIGAPPHRFAGQAPQLTVELRLGEATGLPTDREPPLPRLQGGAGLLGVLIDRGNLALVDPTSGRGLVNLSPEMLAHAYHARYELLEFAIFTLAARSQGLAALHAGCVGLEGQGLLLIGESGAGKSTLALQCLLDGLDFLCEDACFLAPESGLLTGIANFVHLRRDALRFFDAATAAKLAAAPTIRRRSGVEKFEFDPRAAPRLGPLAAAPLKLAGLVFLSAQPAGEAPMRRVPADEAGARFTQSQPYAAGQPVWAAVQPLLQGLAAWELRRSTHPQETARCLRALLEAAGDPGS
ncbi:MAG: hypothetical protein JO006_15770 [Paucibacter sp.]|nr:hypothetical protein [Roseateles sp.]